MARSLDSGMEQESTGKPSKEKVEIADLKIALALAKKTLKEAGGLQALQKGIASSKDPAQVVSKFLVQLIMKIKDSLEQQGIELSPTIVLSQDGWLIQMVDFVETELGLPTEFSEDVIGDVMETFKAMLQGEATKEVGAVPPQGAAPPVAGPPAPMGGAPANMMGG